MTRLHRREMDDSDPLSTTRKTASSACPPILLPRPSHVLPTLLKHLHRVGRRWEKLTKSEKQPRRWP